ncbi:hypothetical protein HZA75_06605 [Candidatus Roizmanbacteria bacterium]|nr:hypothetical protein [Candidatus Roizmanbacteria bacterium]
MKILNFLFFGFLFIPFLFRLDMAQNISNGALLINKEVISVGQTFEAQHNNIYLVKIATNNPKFSSYREPLVFQLKESPQEKNSLVTIPFSSANIGTNYALRMQFAPILQSQGKPYYFEISSPQVASNSALEIRRFEQDVYQEGDAYVNQKKTSGDLTFKVYYKVSLVQFIKDSGGDFLNRISKDSPFVLFYILLMLTTAIVTLSSFLKR